MRLRSCLSCLMGTLLAAGSAHAGMPAPLPTDPERVLRLNATAEQRLQAISFFVLIIVLSATVVRGIWNYLRRDFSFLPRLSFGRALAMVILWGLLFVLVLAMISGARELMTPGAWKKEGFTYTLAGNDPPADREAFATRQHQLEGLRTALWTFAATHEGRLPKRTETQSIPADLWIVPGAGSPRYLYVDGYRLWAMERDGRQ